jgi:UDPglucose 6-dehydrogenase
MNIAVVGTGYVGTTTSVALAMTGHTVFAIDQDPEKVKKLKQHILPFYEEGIEEVLKKLDFEGKLSFTTNLNDCIDKCSILFITVGTPSLPGGLADLSFVEDVARKIGRLMNEYKIIVIKSTVPVGTGAKIKKIIENELNRRKLGITFDLISNPEFLREGKALHDAMYPERIVIGCETENARQIMKDLYKDVRTKIFFTTVIDAEMIKYAANAFLATKISFINEMARFCEKIGANINEVAKGIGMDSRIGPLFLQAGIGYGGSCFPKDVRALLTLASKENTPLNIIQAASNVNETQAEWFMEKVKKELGTLSEKCIAILGLTFKPLTDDIREAPSLKIIKDLIQNKALITAYDPQGTEHVKKIYPDIRYTSTPLEAIKGADAIIIVTEWKEIIDIDWKNAKNIVSAPLIFDGRNALDPSTMIELGFHYVGVGKQDS